MRRMFLKQRYPSHAGAGAHPDWRPSGDATSKRKLQHCLQTAPKYVDAVSIATWYVLCRLAPCTRARASPEGEQHRTRTWYPRPFRPSWPPRAQVVNSKANPAKQHEHSHMLEHTVLKRSLTQTGGGHGSLAATHKACRTYADEYKQANATLPDG